MDVSTGRGATGLFSIIVPRGRTISIFFFAGRVPPGTVCALSKTSLFVKTGRSGLRTGAISVSLEGGVIRFFNFRAHSLHSRFLSPPALRRNVRTVCCFSPELLNIARIKKWSRIAFSPASIFRIVERGISCVGMPLFLLSVRMIRLLVRIASNEMDLYFTFLVSRIMDSSRSSSG